jgi:hypothetical protein
MYGPNQWEIQREKTERGKRKLGYYQGIQYQLTQRCEQIEREWALYLLVILQGRGPAVLQGP